ncbi:alpha-2-macroglobulin [Lampropedia aestuarii]|uniref:Alpha-2-macroglobulin n=1 Tax=Lampropedia aestuarii TaxID=2562762 RepID=A0A4V6S771_9BURK|nr:MG2 domain-containing protein [Lampropedia aestuarii]THJ32182.1 alpha-2-macroglobulin [Lampropedia aestuarii]
MAFSLHPSTRKLAVGLSVLYAGLSQAATIQSITPSGRVSDAVQVVVTMQKAAVPLGQPTATAPVQVHCNGQEAAGSGRWIDERRWVFDFTKPIGGGELCSVQSNAAFKDLDGAGLAATKAHNFNTGGPAVEHILPYRWDGAIDEEQQFLLYLNSPVDLASIASRSWCQTKDVGERIPVRILSEAERSTLLELVDSRYDGDAQANDKNTVALACQRRLTAGTDMTLVWGKGIAAPNGLKTEEAQTFEYTVRAPFEATFSCQREQASEPCIPVLPFELRLSADVDMRWIEQFQLQHDKQSWQPSVQIRDEWGYSDGQSITLSQWQDNPVAYQGQAFNTVVFEGPFPEQAQLSLSLPEGLQDEAGRPLENAAAYPLTVKTGNAPALAKFPTGNFAIIEPFAEGYHERALLPITLRRVEAPLPITILPVQSDAEIIEWMFLTERFSPGNFVSRTFAEEAGIRDLPIMNKKEADEREPSYIEARAISLLNGVAGTEKQTIPASSNNKDRAATEVVGIPLKPGFQVVEAASPALGQALLDPDYASARVLYARTSVLVTNLAVHFKLGGENSLAWVTSLDSGLPVANAKVQINRCDGSVVANATTDSEGIARFDEIKGPPSECRRDGNYWNSRAYMISARSADGEDMGLVWSDWTRGIEPWRFNVPTSSPYYSAHESVAHTVLDRSLLRAGETVSMKHFVRAQTLNGFAAPAQDELPAKMVVRHIGSGKEYEQELEWNTAGNSTASAVSELKLPQSAALGQYMVTLQGERYTNSYSTSSFRVEEFRLPVFEGSMTPVGNATLVGVDSVDMNVQLGYVSGGAAADWPVQISAMLEPRTLRFDNYPSYSFDAPNPSNSEQDDAADNNASTQLDAQRKHLLLDKKALRLNKEGSATFTINGLKPTAQDGSNGLSNLRVEATFEDPNGEMQTITSVRPWWPSDTLVGIATDSWISVKKPLLVRTIVLSPDGSPRANTPVTVRALAHTTLTTRKRMVGGFYKYEHHYESKDLGTVCQGTSDASGRFACTANLQEPGQIELVAQVQDSAKQTFAAATQVWVTREGEMWFDSEASDRMDILPEKPNYEPGETARFQVRMPYRKAQALVAVEREGILETHVIELSGQDPSFTLKVGEAWAPNMYVSVLAVRGRLRDVPWYSFFTWGFRSPIVWWQAWRNDTGEAVAPTAMVDLSKPSHRFGVAAIKVGYEGHRIQVSVKADKDKYAIRDTAKLTIEARLPNGKPAANAEVALAVVDKALLELSANPTWDLLSAMMQTRGWGVVTSTAQMEVLGRRHYGRKSAPAGGGGGSGADGTTRELFDTLVSWQPRIQLDANGKAVVDVKLNDSLTTFHAQAIASEGEQFFGSGSSELVVSQDLQIISGLPPVVRAGDAYDARFTIRNSSDKAMTVQVSGQQNEASLAASTVEIPSGGAQTVQWRVTAPALHSAAPQGAIVWELQADTQGSGPAFSDSLKITQTLLPAVPVTVRQASLRQLTAPLQVQASVPAGAVEGSGHLQIDAQASLAGDILPGLQRWWNWYPYTCLEQRYSKAIGLMDQDLFDIAEADLPSYLDSQGLASFFPPRRPDSGSIYLTAHLLALDAVMQSLDEDSMRMDEASRSTMIEALTNVVEGRLERPYESVRNNRTVDRLFVIAALSAQDAASPSMLESMQITPQRLPTHALLDWLQILKNLPGIAQRAQHLQVVEQELRSRLMLTGGAILFTTEKNDNWWWMMQNGDSNAARLLLLTADLPSWHDDMGGLASGLLARQKNGNWGTTTANIWGQLALRTFAQLHESEPVTGQLEASYAGDKQERAWAPQPAASGNAASRPVNTSTDKLRMDFAWPDAIALLGDSQSTTTLSIEQFGMGKPWVTISALAAVPITEPVSSGLRVEKTITPIQQAQAGVWQQGDIYRVTLTVHSNVEVGMTALTDPIPSGSTILGSGLGRDASIATSTNKDEDENNTNRWSIAWEERKMDVMRVYYYGLPQGATRYQYTVRLNQPGSFFLPPTRAEALYMPQVFAETPNQAMTIGDLPR